ncbi:MAG: DUF599 family protein [Proteobacteria bacterium]|nr:MAG: DUF599 family protein [Pseudomonadota bacterium]
MAEFSVVDIVAVSWFAVCWIGYSIGADHTPLRRYSASTAMTRYRREWMCRMVERDIRIVDAQIHGNLLHGIGFFATTTILAIGGLLALLGSADEAMKVLSDFPFVGQTNRTTWEFKVLLLVLIFIYAFFKFAWAFRLANWNAIFIGAAPVSRNAACESNEYVERAAEINRLSSNNFNRGVRAYFFALAALSWFLHSVVFMVATALVLVVLINREFRTRAITGI